MVEITVHGMIVFDILYMSDKEDEWIRRVECQYTDAWIRC